MARAASPLVEFAATHTPIHADPARDYHWVAGFEAWQRDGNTVTIAARDEEGQALTVRLTLVEPAVLRVQLLTPGAPPPPPTPMLISEEWPAVTLTVEETTAGLTLRTSSLLVEVEREPWRLRVRAAGRPLYQQEHDDKGFDRFIAFPFGYSVGADGSVATHETFALAVEEHLYGLGGQYGALDQRGQRHVGWLREAYGANTTPVTYAESPFFWSSRGYGVFVNHGERVVYELGHPSTVSASFQVDAATLDYFLIAGPEPAAILRRYTALTGRPALPPLWSFGVWMSRCMYRDRAEVEESLTRMRDLGIPVDVYHLDPTWLKNRRGRALDACDFEWDEDAFGPPEQFIGWLRERGVKLSLWENPYVWRDSPMFDEGVAGGYFARTPDGAIAAPVDNPEEAALLDYTNPATVAWIAAKHRRWFDAGVACFKTDYGEGVPADAVFHNGQTGRTVHNLYPLLYNQAVFQASEQARGVGEAVVFGRSGYGGSQRYPLQWTGDPQSTWAGMAGALRCGLSQSMSGAGFWAADIGGFYVGPPWELPDPTLYIRWAQWGLLLSHSRFHGVRPREPWEFGDDAVQIVRDFARLRYRLLPYLWSLAHIAHADGLPVVRPLALAYPDDPVAPHVERQFLLGPDVLVCPVFNAEGRCRVYLPAGRWHDWWDGTLHEGPRHLDLTVPLDRLPLFVRDGSILPLAPPMDYVGAAPWSPLDLVVRGDGPAETVVWTPDERVAVRADRRHERYRVRIENARQTWRVRLIGVTARDVTLTGAATDLSWQVEGSDTIASFTMHGQGSAQLLVTPV